MKQNLDLIIFAVLMVACITMGLHAMRAISQVDTDQIACNILIMQKQIPKDTDCKKLINSAKKR